MSVPTVALEVELVTQNLALWVVRHVPSVQTAEVAGKSAVNPRRLATEANSDSLRLKSVMLLLAMYLLVHTR
jgi:hypothetical protein